MRRVIVWLVVLRWISVVVGLVFWAMVIVLYKGCFEDDDCEGWFQWDV
jgi:hypothetical protein